MPTATLSIAPLTGALGAEVRGVRLAEIDDDGFAAVTAALLEHLVVFFPDQHLTADEHRAFAARFGEAEIHPFIPKLDTEHPEIVVLDSDQRRAPTCGTPTSRGASTRRLCSVLKMVTCPSVGGDTMFSNQYLVYEALSEPMRELVSGLTAVHTAAVFGHPETRAEHPAVRLHPETGRWSLYVNRQFTSHFPQLRRSESDALLAHLFSFSEQPQFTCRYRWHDGGDRRVGQPLHPALRGERLRRASAHRARHRAGRPFPPNQHRKP